MGSSRRLEGLSVTQKLSPVGRCVGNVAGRMGLGTDLLRQYLYVARLHLELHPIAVAGRGHDVVADLHLD